VLSDGHLHSPSHGSLHRLSHGHSHGLGYCGGKSHCHRHLHVNCNGMAMAIAPATVPSAAIATATAMAMVGSTAIEPAPHCLTGPVRCLKPCSSIYLTDTMHPRKDGPLARQLSSRRTGRPPCYSATNAGLTHFHAATAPPLSPQTKKPMPFRNQCPSDANAPHAPGIGDAPEKNMPL
jgi:hypothetical protein